MHFVHSFLLTTLLFAPIAAQTPSALSSDEVEAIDRALDEALGLLEDIRPYPVAEAGRVGELLARWRGEASGERLETLAAEALEAASEEHRIQVAARFAAVVAIVDPLRAAELWERWRGEGSNQSAREQERLLETLLPVVAEHDPGAAVALLRRYSETVNDLEVYRGLFFALLKTKSRQEAVEASQLAKAAWLRQPPSWELVQSFAGLIRALSWVEPHRYLDHLQSVVQRAGTLDPPAGSSYTLTTRTGTVELTATEYILLNNFSVDSRSNPPRGIELLPELSEKVEAVGGWDQLRRGYSSEERLKGQFRSSSSGANTEAVRETLTARNPLILTNPQEAGDDIAALSRRPESLRELLAAPADTPESLRIRAEIREIATKAVVKVDDPRLRLQLLGVLFEAAYGRAGDEDFAFWAQQQQRLQDEGIREDIGWRRQLVQVRGQTDPVGALRHARIDTTPVEQLQLLIAAVSNPVKNRSR